MSNEDLLSYFVPLIHTPDFGDIRILESNSTSISSINNHINVSSRDSLGFGIRIRRLGKWGFSSSPMVSKSKISSAVLSVYHSFRYLNSALNDEVPLQSSSMISKSNLKIRINPYDIDIEDKINMVKNAVSQIEPNANILSKTVLYADKIKKWYISNTTGAFLVFDEIHSFMSIDLRVKCGNNAICKIYKEIGGTGGLEELSNSKVSNAIESINLSMSELHGVRRAKSGKYDIVLDPRAAGTLAHEAIGHMCETYPNRLMAVARIGNNVGSDILNVIDDPTLPKLEGTFHYDQEGTPAKRRVLMKEGVFNECLYSLESAAKSKTSPNGASRSIDYRYQPIPRMSNTYIEKGTYGEDIFEDIKKGILIFGGNGKSNSLTGRFYLKPLYGQTIRNGKLAEYITVSMLEGDIHSMLKGVDALGKEVHIVPRECSKEGQPIPVGKGGPNTRIRGVMVYG